jgi:hypothetical protein
MTQSFAHRSLDAKLNFIQKAFHAVTAARKIREVPDSQIEPVVGPASIPAVTDKCG